MRKMVLVSIGFVVLVGVVVGLLTRPNTSETNNEQSSVSSSSSSEKVADFRIELGDLYYAPDTITAKAGTTISIQLVGLSGAHDFAIDELNVKSNLLFAQDQQIIFIDIPADASGKTFEFYCTIEGHKDAGMVGSLVIE